MGPGPGRQVKAVLSGVANPVITGDALATPVSFEHLAAVGSGMGAAGFDVFDDEACMVAAALEVSRFLSVESCGQCPPCKLGSTAITELLATLHDGAATATTLDEIAAQLERVTDANRCYLGTQERLVVTSILQQFPEEVAEHLAGPCRRAAAVRSLRSARRPACPGTERRRAATRRPRPGEPGRFTSRHLSSVWPRRSAYWR